MAMLLGGLLSWIIPDRVIREAGANDSRMIDFSAFFIACGATALVAGRIVDSARGIPPSFNVWSILGALYFGAVSLLFLLIYTGVYKSALNTSKVEGKLLVAGYWDLLRCHLYTCPIMLALVLLALLTGHPTILFLVAVSIARTVDLQARVIRAVCRIEYHEALKGTVMIAAVRGGMMAAGIWVLLRFF